MSGPAARYGRRDDPPRVAGAAGEGAQEAREARHGGKRGEGRLMCLLETRLLV